MIQNGEAPSEFILRPEVAKVILNHPIFNQICSDL